MKRSLIGLLIFLLSFGAMSLHAVQGEEFDIRKNLSTVEEKCGYRVGKELSEWIVLSRSDVKDEIVSVDLYLDARPSQRSVRGRLAFSCFVAGSFSANPDSDSKTTARDEIALEDSGGRYVRHVVWQRQYKGIGWTGTIAYVNAVFGDGERRGIPDYFLICPSGGELTCFSLEIEGARLSGKEAERIPILLHGVALTKSQPVENKTLRSR